MANESQEETQRILDMLVAKTSFIALPKIVSLAQARVDAILAQSTNSDTLKSETLLEILRTCNDEAVRAEIQFDGILLVANDGNQFYLDATFTVVRQIQIYDVFSGSKIYRIPFEVFHPLNFKIRVHIRIAGNLITYTDLGLLRSGSIPLKWIHVFPSQDNGRLCLGSLGPTFSNVGLDGTFLAKVVSSLEGVNLNSPARGLTPVEFLEPEYHKLAIELVRTQASATGHPELAYHSWNEISSETPGVAIPF